MKSYRIYLIQIAILFLLIVFSFNKNVLAQPLSGSYTIGGSSANFDSLSQAVNALVNNGISGAVIFNIRPGIYEEQVIIPEITGASSSNTITFQSETGVAEDVIWQFENPDWINFDYVLRIDAADHLRLRNLTFNSNVAGVTGGRGVVIAFHNGLSENVIIQDNVFYGISNAAESKGLINDFHNASFPSSLKDLKIINNTFYGFGNGIKLATVTGTTINSGLEILNNNLESDPANRGIYVSSFMSPKIENNVISAVNALEGIRLDLCTGQIDVRNNNVLVHYYGIVLYDYYQSTPVGGLVANNMVIVNTVSTGSGIRLGIYANGLVIAHNTILATGTQSNGAALRFEPPGSFTPNSDLSLINNFFIHTGPGKALVVPNPSKSISAMDYNILYTNGSVLANWNGVDYSTLTDLQNASNLNLNSFSKMPDFKNPNEDLHLIACSIGDEDLKGIPVAGVTTDFDGQIRDVFSPYRGADETYGTPPHLFSSRIAVGLSDSPINFTAGDLDGDGDSDIAVVLGGSTNLVSVHWNNNGDFSSSTDFEFGLSPTVVKIADLDADNKNDLICLSDTIFVRYGDGGGNFTAPVKMPMVGVNYSPPAVTDFDIADIDDDGHLDIVQSHLGIVGVQTGHVSIYFGSGNRNFMLYEASQPTGLEHPATIRLADMNNDNKLDVIVEDFVNDEIGVYENILPDINVFLNAVVYNTNHGGSGPLHANFDVYDFDGDNYNDVMLGQWITIFAADTLVLLHNDGSTPFLENMRGIKTDDYRSSVTFTAVDYDLDNDIDILYATTSREISILLNDGSGNFESIVGCNPVGGNIFNGDALTILHSNLNNDNLPDIAVLTQSDSFYIYLNAGWIPTSIRQSEEEILSVTDYELLQNYPNPFNPTTTIKYSIPIAGLVTLTVYNILGEQVKTLINQEMPAGNHSVQFNASSLASGIYLYRIQFGSFVQTRKMIFLK